MSRVAVAIPLLMILMLVFILIPVLVGIYVYRDATRRGMNALLWTLIAVIAPSLIGFIVYLLVRGNYSDLRCPQCDTPVKEQYLVCPGCGAKLHPVCSGCGAPVESGWKVCPRCAQPLPEFQEQIVAPVRSKDKTLWKIILAIILIPVLLILTIGISFSAASGGGSSSLREVSFDEYFQDQEVPESTKEYVQDWLDGLASDLDHAYALMYERTYEPERSDGRSDYYYLIYVPGGGLSSTDRFGYSSGLFRDSFILELEGTSGQDGLFCAETTSKKGRPKLNITLNGRKLEVEIISVDFNPTLYTIASEHDYSTLTGASGDLYIEEMEQEMKPVAVEMVQFVDGEQADTLKFSEPDFLLNTVVELHRLQALDEVPTVLGEDDLDDCYLISLHYADTTGEAHYNDVIDYEVVQTEDGFYLLDPACDLVYEITAEAYKELELLFN